MERGESPQNAAPSATRSESPGLCFFLFHHGRHRSPHSRDTERVGERDLRIIKPFSYPSKHATDLSSFRRRPWKRPSAAMNCSRRKLQIGRVGYLGIVWGGSAEKQRPNVLSGGFLAFEHSTTLFPNAFRVPRRRAFRVFRGEIW